MAIGESMTTHRIAAQRRAMIARYGALIGVASVVLSMSGLGNWTWVARATTSPRTLLATNTASLSSVGQGGLQVEPRLAQAGSATTPALDIAGLIDQTGRTVDPQHYGGVVAQDNGNAADVYLTTLTADTERPFIAAAAGASVRFFKTPFSIAEQEQTRSAIESTWISLVKRGIDIVQFGPDVQTGLIRMGVMNLSSVELTTLSDMFGAPHIDVYNMTPEERPVFTSDRGHDSTPWKAGDAIEDGSEGCTTGFGVNIGSITRNLGAGHCFYNGNTLYNAACTSAGCATVTGSGTNMGIADARDTDSPGLDTATWLANSGGATWRGPIGSPYLQNVVGSTSNVVGDHICNSGAYSGEVCNLVIESTGNCLELEDEGGFDHYDCRLALADNTSGGVANETGDSGGPIYREISNKLYAVGTGSAEDLGTHEVACTSYVIQTCSDDIYYTEIGPILTYWGAAIR